jgi:hypothetical protein
VALTSKIPANFDCKHSLVHDFNNRLTVIIAQCELLFDNTREHPECSARLNEIKSSALRMAELLKAATL